MKLRSSSSKVNSMAKHRRIKLILKIFIISSSIILKEPSFCSWVLILKYFMISSVNIFL